MVTKGKSNASKKKGNKRRVKTLTLKREVKDVTARDKKKVKGGGGLSGGVIATTKLTQ